MKQYDVIVVGAGAAGLMCAWTAGRRGRSVLVLERANKPGKKILMSGGGRCNFTNLYVEPDRFRSANPHFCKSALARYTQWDFIEQVERHGIAYHEKQQGDYSRGQLYCDESARQILDMLLRECREVGAELRLRCDLQTVDRRQGRFQLQTSQGEFATSALVIASGGLSVPTLGGSGRGYEIARQFGHAILPTRAGLVPMTFTEPWRPLFAALAGVAVDVEVSTATASHRGPVLMTHRGLSGPAILRASSDWREGETIGLDLLPGLEVAEWLQAQKRAQPRARLHGLLSPLLPKALVQALEQQWWAGQAELALAQWSDKALIAVAAQLADWRLRPAGTEGYRTAEVTLGGVDTEGLSSSSMESRYQSGLFFIGEVVDVSGDLGGFNFQWAWSSGRAAGLAL